MQARKLKTYNLLLFTTIRKAFQYNSYATSKQRQEIYIYFFFITSRKTSKLIV